MSATMKAFVYYGPEDGRLQDVPVPQISAADDVIVRVELSTICGSDIHIWGGHLNGFLLLM